MHMTAITKIYVSSMPTQSSIHSGSVNEYQPRLERQRQVWFIPSADKRVGVHCAGKTVKSLDNALPYLSALEVGCLQ